MNFVIHWNETAIGLHVFPIPFLMNSCDAMDCGPPGSSVHGISQARILEWVAIHIFRGSSWPRDQTQVSCIIGRFFTFWAASESPLKICVCYIHVLCAYSVPHNRVAYNNPVWLIIITVPFWISRLEAQRDEVVVFVIQQDSNPDFWLQSLHSLYYLLSL